MNARTRRRIEETQRRVAAADAIADQVHHLEIEGRVVVRLDVWSLEDRGVEIRHLATLPEFQGQGHATKAMKELLRKVDWYGLDVSLFADAFGKMPIRELVRWYEKLGFTKDKAVRDGVWMYRTAKTRNGTPHRTQE